MGLGWSPFASSLVMTLISGALLLVQGVSHETVSVIEVILVPLWVVAFCVARQP